MVHVLLALGLQHVECGHCLLGGVGDLRHELGSSVVPGFAADTCDVENEDRGAVVVDQIYD